MGFTLDPGMVEGNLFNRRSDGWTGKWKYAVALNMNGYWDDVSAVDAVQRCWVEGKFQGTTHVDLSRAERVDRQTAPDGFWLVVFEPYHRNAHPVMISV